MKKTSSFFYFFFHFFFFFLYDLPIAHCLSYFLTKVYFSTWCTTVWTLDIPPVGHQLTPLNLWHGRKKCYKTLLLFSRHRRLKRFYFSTKKQKHFKRLRFFQPPISRWNTRRKGLLQLEKHCKERQKTFVNRNRLYLFAEMQILSKIFHWRIMQALEKHSLFF